VVLTGPRPSTATGEEPRDAQLSCAGLIAANLSGAQICLQGQLDASFGDTCRIP